MKGGIFFKARDPKELAALFDDFDSESVHFFDETEDGEYGKFRWILDSEGNKVELGRLSYH